MITPCLKLEDRHIEEHHADDDKNAEDYPEIFYYFSVFLSEYHNRENAQPLHHKNI